MAIDEQLKTKILEATEDGLQILCDLTGLNPSDVKTNGKTGVSRKAFRSPLRSDDDKPSAFLFKGAKGNWGIKDFATGEWVDCFEFFMREEHFDNFFLALMELARKYGVEVEGKQKSRKATSDKLTEDRITEIRKLNRFVSVDDKTGEEKHFHLEFKEEFELADLAVFNPKVSGNSEEAKDFYNEILQACKFYNIRPVKYYETVKVVNGIATGTRKTSTDSYPIFAFDNDTWGKVYEPFASGWTTDDKVVIPPLRFRHYGNKPNRFLYGHNGLASHIEQLRKEELERLMSAAGHDPAGVDDDTIKVRKRLKLKADMVKIPQLILCSGGSDGINIKAMGYPAVWSNSETEFIQPKEMRELKSYAEEIYYVGDLDKAGQDSAHKIALMYMDVRIIRLPSELSDRNSWSKKPCKDVKDFARYYSKADFAGLMRVAFAYQFWNRKTNANGKPGNYELDIVNARFFLEKQGFFRYPNHTNKLQYEMVKQDEHIMAVHDGISIKNFLEAFVYNTHQEKDVLATIMKAKIVGEQLIHSLPEWKGEFTKGTKDSMYFFFKNQAWKVTPKETTVVKTVTGYSVWEDELLFPERRAPEIQNPFFSVVMDEDGKPQLTIHRQDHPIMQYFINSSRIHWKKEFDHAGVSYYESNEFYAEKELNKITSKHLSEAENQEQVLHFLSKVAALGYAFHDCKQASKAWLIWCTDNNEREVNTSFGRTGKSLFGRCIKELLPTEYFEGRKVDTTTLFHLQNVTDKKRLIWYDDVAPGFTINSMFSSITGPMKVESKHGRAVEIAFEKSPKYLVTSNFTIKDRDPSTNGRLWVLSWSDFYHGESTVHPGKKTIANDLGHTLFSDWDESQWNGYINFVKDCVAVWLTAGRIDPPLHDIKRQQLRTIMGPNFIEWAEGYLIPKVNKRASGTDEPSKIKALDTDFFFPKKAAEEDFANFIKKRNSRERSDATGFKTRLDAFIEYNNLILDPPALKNSRGNIEKRYKKEKLKEFGFDGTEDKVLHSHYLLEYVSAAELENVPPPIPDELPFNNNDDVF